MYASDLHQVQVTQNQYLRTNPEDPEVTDVILHLRNGGRLRGIVGTDGTEVWLSRTIYVANGETRATIAHRANEVPTNATDVSHSEYPILVDPSAIVYVEWAINDYSTRRR